MNDKNQSQSRQDSEELLVTSSTSSSSNLVETRATISTPSSSPTARPTDFSLTTITTTTSSSSGSLCQIVTSSTGNNSNSASNLDEDDDDDIDTALSTDYRLTLVGVSDGNKTPTTSTPEMGGRSSNNDGDTCIVIPTSSSYIEQRNDNNKNMLLTTRSTESDNNIESSVPTASSVISAPTTRSKRKLLNNEAGGTAALGLNHSISLNNSKCINLDVKNHQMTKKKTAATTSSINSLSHSSDAVKVVTTSIGGKNLGTLKNSEDSGGASSSSSSNKRNCVNEDESTESHNDHNASSNYNSSKYQSTTATINCSDDSNDDSVADNRKVEPLKINLNRDMVKTKITIKPIVKPAELDNEQHVTKLNCVDQQHHEPHIVPKLTIRASDCNSSSLSSEVKHSVVPKLTIKMDGTLNCIKESSSSPSSTPPPPPLPKLTIKTTGDTSESIITSCISSSSILSSSPTSSAQPTVPKLTIKAISKSSSTSSCNASPDQTIPKFTIKTTASSLASSQLPSTSTIIDHDEMEMEIVRTNSPIPKLTIKTVQDSESNSANQTVPRLKIRTKPEQEAVANDLMPLTIPKFTIKAVQENYQSIPKLTISVNDRVEASSSSSCESIPKLTVVRHSEQDEGERVPKLTIALQESPKVKQSLDSEAEKQEKVPKLTIKTISDQDLEGTERVPKLTIKGISDQDLEGAEKVPKLTIKAISDQDLEGTEKVPKLTIKGISDQDLEGAEKVPKLTIKTISDQDIEGTEKVPKITIKGISDQDLEGAEKVPKLTIKTISDQDLEGTEKVPKLTIKGISDQDLEGAEKVPKLTIKTISDQDIEGAEKVPKLTIKGISDQDLEGNEKVPKLTIKGISDQDLEGAEKVPKLTIKTIPVEETETCEKSEKVSKLTIKAVLEQNHEGATERVPKLMIKTISEQDPEGCEKFEKVLRPRLTIKTISEQQSDSHTSEKSENEPILTIKSILEQGTQSVEKVPKLTIKTVLEHEPDSSEKCEKLCKVAQSITETDEVEKVPKLTIKSIPDNNEIEKFPKLTIKQISSSETKEKVPKLTIRQVQESDECDRTTLVVSTVERTEELPDSCSRIPKLTIKPLPEIDDIDKGSKPTDEDKLTGIKVRKLKIKNIPEFDKLPKLTIKPIVETDTGEPVEKKSKLIVQQSSVNCEETEKVPKLTIKQISNNFDDSSSTSPSPKVPKPTINNHGTFKLLKRSCRTRKFDSIKDRYKNKNNDAVEIVTNNEVFTPNKVTLMQTRSSKLSQGRTNAKLCDSVVRSGSKLKKSGLKNQRIQANSFQEKKSVKANNEDTISKNVETQSKYQKTSTKFQLETRASSRKNAMSLNTGSNIELELKMIKSESKVEADQKTASTSRSNIQIDADLSDDAINDLVDILNDELNSTAPLNANTNIIDCLRPESTESNSICDKNSPASSELISTNSKNHIGPSERDSDVKTNIPDEALSLASDEDDIVDQLAELLNDAHDMDDIAEEFLLDSKSEISDTKKELISERIAETNEPTTVEESEKKEFTTVEKEKSLTSSSDVENLIPSSVIRIDSEPADEDIYPEVITIGNSSNDASEKFELQQSDLNDNTQSKENCLQVDIPENSLLHSILSQKIVETVSTLIDSNTNISECLNLSNVVPTKSDLGTHLNSVSTITEIDLTSDEEVQTISLKSVMTEDHLTFPALKECLGVNSADVKPNLKRSAVDDTIDLSYALSPKKHRSDSSDNNADQLTVENSLDSDIMIVQGNDSPTPISKQPTSSIVDLEGSSLTGDETSRTLTELKTINDVVNEHEEESMSVKEANGENSNLEGILTRLQQHQSDNSLTSQNSFKSSNNSKHKSAELEISVVTSTPPHSNSLKTTQNILLINEESGSDCLIVDEDPLMLLQKSIEMTLDDGDKKNHHDMDSTLGMSRSMKSEAFMEVNMLPLKRPRGRPRKDGQPAGSVKKKEDPAARRKFKGVLMDSHNSMVERTNAKINVFSTPSHMVSGLSETSTPEFRNMIPLTPPNTIVRRGRGGSSSRVRGSRGRGGRGARTRCIGGLSHTPEKRKDGEFFTPDRRKMPESKTSSLQVFEEDTRMSADLISTPLSARQSDLNADENTQSSMLSINSALDGGSSSTANTTEKKKRSKMEVFAPEGKTDYTVDMIAEYDWPPPKGCCPARNRDTFMIQEQIAQYLGIKSFKRKYPDLPRRQVDMEERNYLQEKGLVTEKMCDLGITAVWASDVLDIMYSDFYDKYEEYKTYLREKQLRDIEAKQKALAAEAVDKSLQARERALESASKWNCNFNKARKQDRRLCLDLQSLVINLPATVGEKLSRPHEAHNFRQSSDYPIALVPGQFAENYRVYSPRELRYYPINTILDPFDDRLRPKIEHDDEEDDSSSDDDNESVSSNDISSSGSDSESSESSDSDSDSSGETSSDEDKPPDSNKYNCFVCHQPQNKKPNGFPEVFVRCVTCRKRTHPSCIEMPSRMVMRVRNYNWQCADCKCCIKCKRKQDESKMLYCEQCDRGFHIYCIQIKTVPDGRWQCERCAICMRCGSTKPEGNLPPPPLQPNQKPSRKRAKWVNEYRVDHLTKLREHNSILCVPCARLKTKQRTTTS